MNLLIHKGPNGQANMPNGVYPSNYGVYLSNSSLFSKLGNEIINSNGKINVNSGKRDKITIGSLNPPTQMKNLKSNISSQINGLNQNNDMG